MSSFICHDFKTPRLDASRRLPQVFKLVPVVFYAALVGGAYFNISSYLGYSRASRDRDTWKQNQAEQQQAKEKVETEKNSVLKEKARAEKLAQWVEGTRSLQPITVAIARSLPPEVTVGSLTMDRSAELPSQIILNLTLNNGSVEEVARMQDSLNALSYRPYNAQQTKTGDSLEYRTLLVWQDRN